MWIRFATLPTDAELASIRAVGYMLSATSMHVATIHGNSYAIEAGVDFWVAEPRDQTDFQRIGGTEQAGAPPTQPDPIEPGVDIYCHKAITQANYDILVAQGAVKDGCKYEIVEPTCDLG